LIISRPKCNIFVDDSDLINSQIPVVFLHGFMGSHASWNELISKINIPSLTIDLPGHGKSKFKQETIIYTFDDWVSDFKHILDTLNVSKIYLCGYSMGGRLAMTFATQYPNYIETLTLESTTPGIENYEGQSKRKLLDLNNAKSIRENYSKFLTSWEQLDIFANQKSRNFDGWNKQKDLRKSQSPVQIALVLESLGTGLMSPLWNNLSQLNFPVSIITGDEDSKFNLIAQEMSKCLPISNWINIPNCGHNVHLEQLETFVEILP
jgi:2-succinyl-6-hydroxy-2,4-cyclohexadiene-1-carboxylate synthase